MRRPGHPLLDASLLAALCLCAACATPEREVAADIDPGNLPDPDTALAIEGLGPCTDNPDRTVRLNAGQPLHVLVHGCHGSSGQLRGLAQVLALHGQQSVCFTYDDRAKLTDSASALRRALGQLGEQTAVPQLTVVGHSQGSLIARKSLTESLPEALPPPHVGLRLVTVSGPFSGIDSARACGRSGLYPLTLGLLPLSCYAATGPKWADITQSSRFIREPGALSPRVAHYLKIDTDEQGTCRRQKGGRCVEADKVFSLAEQRNEEVESGSQMVRVEVNAGHVEIVGDTRMPPNKLITVLQEQGVLHPTPPVRASAISRLPTRLYLAPAPQTPR